MKDVRVCSHSFVLSVPSLVSHASLSIVMCPLAWLRLLTTYMMVTDRSAFHRDAHTVTIQRRYHLVVVFAVSLRTRQHVDPEDGGSNCVERHGGCEVPGAQEALDRTQVLPALRPRWRSQSLVSSRRRRRSRAISVHVPCGSGDHWSPRSHGVNGLVISRGHTRTGNHKVS